jgi:hypothetical protein
VVSKALCHLEKESGGESFGEKRGALWFHIMVLSNLLWLWISMALCCVCCFSPGTGHLVPVFT